MLTMLDGADAHRYARRHLGFFTYWRCRIEDFMSNLQKTESNAAWISVADGFPEGQTGFSGLPVLLAWDDGAVESGYYCGGNRFQHADGDMDYHREEKVTHWMPLPPAPNARVKAAAEGSPATERSEP